MKIFIGCSAADSLTLDTYNLCGALIRELAATPDVDLVLGGASSGLMQLCYQTFKDCGKNVTIVLDKTRENEALNYIEDQVFVEETTFDRTKRCYQESDMAVFLEGGTGTMTEILGVREEVRTTNRDYPIYLYNMTHLYDPLFQLFKEGVKRRTISKAESTMYMKEVKEVDEVIREIDTFKITHMKGENVK